MTLARRGHSPLREARSDSFTPLLGSPQVLLGHSTGTGFTFFGKDHRLGLADRIGDEVLLGQPVHDVPVVTLPREPSLKEVKYIKARVSSSAFLGSTCIWCLRDKPTGEVQDGEEP